MYVHVYVCVYIYTHIHMQTYIVTYIYIYIYVFLHVRVYTNFCCCRQLVGWKSDSCTVTEEQDMLRYTSACADDGPRCSAAKSCAQLAFLLLRLDRSSPRQEI